MEAKMIPIIYTLESAYYGQFCFALLYDHSSTAPDSSRHLQIAFTSLHKRGGLPYHVTMTSKQGTHNYIFRHNESCHENIPLEQARKIWCQLVGEGWEAVS